MIIRHVAHPEWHSNSYLVAAAPGGDALFVDAGGPVASLLAVVEEQRLRPTHLLLTHRDDDHHADVDALRRAWPEIEVLAHADELPFLPFPAGALDLGRPLAIGDLAVEVMPTPGHSSGSVCFHIDGHVFTGDTLYKGSVGANDPDDAAAFEALRDSVMRILSLPPDTVIHPGHADPTTVGEELATNPFVRLWNRHIDARDEPCTFLGVAATLVALADDYDGGQKAWIRLSGGADRVVAGSKVERGA